MQNTEIEIQVQVENSRPLLKFLEANATFTGEKHQLDSYYSPAHKDYLATRPVNEWLRIRREGERASINYKNWYREEDGRSHHCDEYETPVDKPEQAELIFQALQMKLLTTVNKKRSTYRYQDYEIALDHIEGLGDFVELEYKGESNEVKPAEVTEQMIAFLKAQGVGKIWRNYVGYPYQLLFPDEVVLEEV